MPSPFPGMDPFIESRMWQGFHADLAVETKRFLAPRLGKRYYPFTERYEVLEYQDEVLIAKGSMYPDVGIAPAFDPTGALATGVAIKSPVRMKGHVPARVPHYRIEIRDVDSQEVVTIIEFLSPSNKNGAGREKYLRKRRRILLSSVHLVEIDFLLQGERLPMDDPYPEGDYFVLISREERRPFFDAWPISLEEPLPRIPIPLLEGDADVPLALQEIFQHVFDLGLYGDFLSYRKPLDLTLTPRQEAVIARILQNAGIMPQ